MADSTVRIVFKGDSSSADRAVSSLDNGFSKLGAAAKVAGVAIVAGLGAALVYSVKQAVDFEKAMRNVNSIAKLSEKQFESLSKEVLKLSSTTGKGPTELAKGLYDIVSSGFKANDAIKILAVSAKAASAGMTTTATASKAVTAALNAYHLGADQARKVSDILFQTVNKGVLTFEELAQNMGDLVPAAAPLGVTLEEVGASMATLTLQGVPAAEAATRVKNTMLQLASPSKALSGLLRENGYASGEAAIKALGFSGVLEMLQKATGGSVTETAKLTPEIRALLGVVGLTGKNLETYNQNLKAMKEAQQGAGATAAAFAEQAKSVAFQWERAKATLQVLAVQLGTPLLGPIRGALSAFSEFVTKLTEADGAAAKFGVVLDAVRQFATNLWNALVSAVTSIKWGDVWKIIETALFGGMVQSNAVAKQFGQAYSKGIYTELSDALRAIDWRAAISDMSTKLAMALNRVSDAIDKVDWNQFGRDLTNGFGRAIAGINWTAVLSANLKFGVALVKAWNGALMGVSQALADGLESVIRKAAGAAFSAASELGASIQKGVANGMAGIAGAVGGKLTALGGQIRGWAGSAFAYAFQIGSAIVSGILSGVGNLASRLGSYVSGQIGSALSHIDIPGRSPVDHAAAEMIGKPMAQGIIDGFARTFAGAATKLSATVTKEMNQLQREIDRIQEQREAQDRQIAVRQAQAAVAAAQKEGKGVAEAKLALFRAEQDVELAQSAKRISTMQSNLEKLANAIEARKERFRAVWDKLASAAIDAFDRTYDKLRTNAERELDLIERTEAEKARQMELASAKAELAAATTDDARLAAGERVRKAELAIRVAALQEQAAVERTALDAQIERKRTSFETALANLEKQLEKEGATQKVAHARIMALYKAFGVDYQKAGAAMGQAVVDGLASKLAAANALKAQMASLNPSGVIGAGNSNIFAPTGQVPLTPDEIAALNATTTPRATITTTSVAAPPPTAAPPPSTPGVIPDWVPGGVRLYAKGALNVPNTGLAMLHAGEQVLTAAKVSSMAGAGGWGGGAPQVSVQIANGMEWLRDFINIAVDDATPRISRTIGMQARDRLLTGRR